jgi:hypothetical protein
MSVMLDIVFSAVLVGMLIISIMHININITDENYRGIVELHTQTEAIQLARIIEFDFYKAGYHKDKVNATTGEIIEVADSSRIKFYSDITDNGTVIPVEYNLGNFNSESGNPRDKSLYRSENTSVVYINYSVTKFRLWYYDTKDSLLNTPVLGAMRDSIRSVRVLLSLESPEPFDTTREGGKQYTSATYQKLIYPRNL